MGRRSVHGNRKRMSMDDDSITKLTFGCAFRCKLCSSVDPPCFDDTSNGSPLKTAFKRSQIEMSISDKHGERVKLGERGKWNRINSGRDESVKRTTYLISVFGVEKSLVPDIVVVCLITTLISGRFGNAPLDWKKIQKLDSHKKWKISSATRTVSR